MTLRYISPERLQSNEYFNIKSVFLLTDWHDSKELHLRNILSVSPENVTSDHVPLRNVVYVHT
jgi:hypothetical protein